MATIILSLGIAPIAHGMNNSNGGILLAYYNYKTMLRMTII
jgi:hypothetical protein